MNRLLGSLFLCFLVSSVIAQTQTPSPIPFSSVTFTPTPTSVDFSSVTPTPSPILFTPSTSVTPSRPVASISPAPAGRNIEIDFPNMIPQGIAWSSRNGFLVSSLGFGTIYSVGFDGTLAAVYESEQTQHTSGLRIDNSRQRLYVANSATYPGKSNIGNILCFDLVSGAQIFKGFVTNVGGALPVYVNQLALDPSGNVYATDSYSGRIFKVDPEGLVSLFFSHPLFEPQDGNTIGITGIECWNSDYLIVTVYGSPNTAEMYKIPLSNPSSFTLVKIQNLAFPFSLLWDSSINALLMVTTDGNLHQVQSDNSFETALIVGSETVAFNFPTGVTLSQGSPFVVNVASYSSGPYYIAEMRYDIVNQAATIVSVVLAFGFVLLALVF